MMERPRPNELTLDPSGDRAARRVEAFFERLDRTSPGALDMLAVRPLDDAAHAAAVERATAAAARLGRTRLVTRTGAVISDAIPRRLSAAAFKYGEPIVVGGLALRPADVPRLVATLRDAALAVIADDAIDGQTSAELVGPCDQLVEGLVSR
jgi:hypothetical protein